MKKKAILAYKDYLNYSENLSEKTIKQIEKK